MATSQINHYCLSRDLELVGQLGEGKDGKVWQTQQHTAVKAHEYIERYQRERDAYIRLKECQLNQVGSFRLPRILNYDDAGLVLELSIVSPPFMLDFASAWLDEPPDFTQEIIEHWHKQIEERFEPRGGEVIAALHTLARRSGVYMLDANPNNIKFE